MAKDIAATGHVALYGIYFDHHKADLKPESAPTVAEIAKLLKQDPKLTMYVVGTPTTSAVTNTTSACRSAAPPPS